MFLVYCINTNAQPASLLPNWQVILILCFFPIADRNFFPAWLLRASSFSLSPFLEKKSIHQKKAKPYYTKLHTRNLRVPIVLTVSIASIYPHNVEDPTECCYIVRIQLDNCVRNALSPLTGMLGCTLPIVT